ncbi:MAG: LEA type 2 family protein [Bacteroidales bacterium]|nr:LEA type 2 family protein [Bacteroidales bacterium]
MKKPTLFFLIFMVSLGLLPSCDVVNQATQAVNLINCEFRIKSVTEIKLAGIDVNQISNMKDLTWSDAQKLMVALTKPTLPLTFLLNIDARNPNLNTAGLSNLDYIVFIDDIQMTSGTFNQPISIPPNNGTASIPMGMTVDLKQVLQGKSADAILNFAMNLSGTGGKPTRFKVKLKPYIMVNGQPLSYPGYITVKTEFSGSGISM